MTYQEAVSWLYGRLPAWHRIGKAAYKANLDNTHALDAFLGHPHKSFRTVHVAGTNGKGSVSHMLASVFQEAGCKTGLYTSPHLRDFRERIRINGSMIPEKEVIDFIEHTGEMVETLQPSFFELTVAMAFDYFARMAVDVAVIEVGMGGRLDSTNIISPQLSVITNIGHDHMEFLGHTLAGVAEEKAGIIKEGIPVVVGETQFETEDIFKARSELLNAPLKFADKEFKCTLGTIDYATGVREYMLYDLRSGTSRAGTVPLGGLAQQRNLQTVASSVERLSGIFGLNDDHFRRGVTGVVTNTGLMGRWQIIKRSPLTVCDTAHNKEGLEYVMEQINTVAKQRLHMVIGFVNDKDLSSLLPLFPAEAFYYFTKASIPRALDERELMSEAGKHNLAGQCYPTVPEALSAALAAASPDDMIFIGGSTFVVAEVI